MYFWGLVKKVVQQVEDLSFFLLFLLFYKKVKKSEKKYKKVFSTFPDASQAYGPLQCGLSGEVLDHGTAQISRNNIIYVRHHDVTTWKVCYRSATRCCS